MDRPEPGLVKWSSNIDLNSFVHLNLQHRVVQLYEPTGHAHRGSFDYKKLTRHDDFPPLTTYDWSPTNAGLLAVGTGTGVVNLLRIDDGSNAYVELGLKMIRTCQAVAFNTQGLLAVGLDRVRMDQSLHIWDVNRLSAERPAKGFSRDAASLVESKYRLEPSVSVSSIKFFEDSPQTLVVGIKGQGLRIHDLRDPGVATTFQTKCTNNLAIDYADQHYFASSSLDHPGVMVWDRRANKSAVASHPYTRALEEEELPWGCAVRLDRAVESDVDSAMGDGKHSLIRSLRYSRDHPGLLAVLSRTGQLRLLQTNRETPTSDVAPQGPELLQVQRSFEMDPLYREPNRRNDRIVSFDWVTLGPSSLRPRLLVLRASGNFDILEQPSPTSDHLFKLIPWQAPHRGLEEGMPYHDLMHFEASQVPEMLGPLLVEQRLSDFPIFASDCPDIEQTIEKVLEDANTASCLVEQADDQLPEAFKQSTSVPTKLRALRSFVREQQGLAGADASLEVPSGVLADNRRGLSLNGVGSCREIHEALLDTLPTAKGLPREAQCVSDHTMLLRAKDKYLFDAVVNRHVVSDDPWARFVWDWIADAEQASEDGALVMSNMDLSYLGVYSIWMNDLGRNPSSRLANGASVPDAAQWERAIGSYCKKHYLPEFDGVSTKRSHHRQLCLEICGWGSTDKHDPEGVDREPDPEYPSTMHTMTACRALFRGDVKQATQILRHASEGHPELLFVSLALQLMSRSGKQPAKDQLDFDEAVASKTDPYLRAMSSLIATGDWTAIANQRSLPLSDRAFVAVRNFSDDQLTAWLTAQVREAVETGDIEGIVLTGITDSLVDIFACYIDKFHDVQTATLVLSICYPRFIDDIRCRAWRNAYRGLLQRHRMFFQRTKFEVESTKRSKREGVPTLKPPSRQIALRCVYCDAETSLGRQQSGTSAASAPGPSAGMETRDPLLATSISAGVSCPNCGRHLPRCVVCLEIVGVPRSDHRPGAAGDKDRENGHDAASRTAARFPTFCLKCEHVLHLDHARQWFGRHAECPVPECRCRCNFRANPELSYR